METYTDHDLIAELQQYEPPVEIRTGGVTQQEWSVAQNIDVWRASRQLNKFLKEGKVVMTRQRCEDGRIRNVYYKP